jgi:hypothetical protein
METPIGLDAVTPTPCRHCQSTLATIGTGKKPHAASLVCLGCGRWLRWLSAQHFDFLQQVLTHFGRPSEPIKMEPLTDGGGLEAVTHPDCNSTEVITMKTSDFFPSQYLRAADLAGKERTVTIDRVEAVLFENDGRKQKKPVIHFKDTGVKPLVTNKTNFTMIAAAHGDDSDTWAGKRIVVYPDMVAFKGQVQEAVRVKRVLAEEMNDAIPF